MKLRLTLCSLLLVLLLPLLTACGESKKTVPSLTEVETMTAEDAAEALNGFRRQDILDAWGEPQDVSDALSSAYMDLYDAPTLGGWVAVRYDASGLADPDADLNTLPVDGVELQTIG